MMKLKPIFALVVLLFTAVVAVQAQSIKMGKLTCEYIENPLGIDITKPLLGWQILGDKRNQRQIAYSIMISDDPKLIKNLTGNIWNSGKIISSQSTNIEYNGTPLKPFKKYYWRVRVFDQNDAPTLWSDPATFETAMLQPQDWQAKWISDSRKLPEDDSDFYKKDQAPLFRKSFQAKKKIESARLYITGLGYYEAYINGDKIGDHVLDPGWTNYDKEILYSTYDVTDNIKRGEANVIGIMVGNGWYNVLPLHMWGGLDMRKILSVGMPCVKAQLLITYSDGKTDVIATDDSWQTAPGPILRNSIYLGEQYDARLEQSGWSTPGDRLNGAKSATVVKAPTGTLVAQMQPAIKVTKTITPVAMTEPKDGVYLFDMGQNFAGVAQLNVTAPKGTRITLRYGEDKYRDGGLNVMTSVAGQIKAGNGGAGAPDTAWQEDVYITRGGGKETWQPRFTFHGFRYVEVSGLPTPPAIDDIKGLRMNSDVEDAGTFTCSNPMFNKLDDVLNWTFKSNLFSVQSDCPAREKFGYGGDLFATSEAFMYHFNMAVFYRKVMADFANDQRPQGGITELAPFNGIADAGLGDSTGPISFQLVFPYVVKQLYDFYGDKRIIQNQYPAVVKLAKFLQDSAKGNLHTTDLSDHESLTPKSEGLTASATYYKHIKLAAAFANILGKNEDQKKYDSLAAEIQKAIVAKYLDSTNGKVDIGTQTAQAYMLWNAIVSDTQKDKVLKVLVKDVDSAKGHLNTGMYGTKMMFDVLRSNNQNEVAYTVANRRSFPGYGYMIDNGATTLWETWAYSDNIYSQNHPMFGSVGEWFYRSLLGINAGAAGFERIIIKPQPAGDLTFAKGSYMSVKGPIVSSWQKSSDRFTLHVEIPANTFAEIWVPLVKDGAITEDGKALAATDDMKMVRTENGYAVFETGSGKYDFASGSAKK